jgi:hypothetical protein
MSSSQLNIPSPPILWLTTLILFVVWRQFYIHFRDATMKLLPFWRPRVPRRNVGLYYLNHPILWRAARIAPHQSTRFDAFIADLKNWKVFSALFNTLKALHHTNRMHSFFDRNMSTTTIMSKSLVSLLVQYSFEFVIYTVLGQGPSKPALVVYLWSEALM